MIYLQLFITFFKIGLFSFGGGYAMLSLIKQEVVTNHQWISNTEFTDIVAVSQVTPGPVAINSATYIGYTTTGNILGSVASTIGVIMPSVFIMGLFILFLAKFRKAKFIDRGLKGIRYIIIGLILGAALALLNRESFIDIYSILLFLGALIATLKFKIGPIPITIASGVIGVILYSGLIF